MGNRANRLLSLGVTESLATHHPPSRDAEDIKDNDDLDPHMVAYLQAHAAVCMAVMRRLLATNGVLVLIVDARDMTPAQKQSEQCPEGTPDEEWSAVSVMWVNILGQSEEVTQAFRHRYPSVTRYNNQVFTLGGGHASIRFSG